MFGRRHPILGAAVLVGASKSAARHEIEKQEQRDEEIQLVAERKRREEAETDKRTKLAVEEAIAKEKAINNKTEQAPAYTNYVHGIDQKKGSIRYCTECGHMCKLGDRFCAGCGCKQLVINS
jgi:hypothetical protein